MKIFTYKGLFLTFCVATLFSSLFFTSCGASGPENADSPGIKNWVLEKCCYSQKFQEFVNELTFGNISVKGFESWSGMDAPVPMNLSHACVLLLDYYRCMSEDVGLNKQKFVIENLERVVNFLNEDSPYFPTSDKDFETSYYRVLSEIDTALPLIRSLMEAYADFSFAYADSCVQMVNYDFDLDATGDTYDGYYITYRIVHENAAKPYVLMQLTEFEDGRYEVSIVDKERVISDLDIYGL